VTLERSGRVYDEETFDYCLRLERERAALTGVPCFLVLVSARPGLPGKGRNLSRSVSSPVFDTLEAFVREIDSIGWYREGRIAGAVLPQGLESSASDAAAVIAARIDHALSRRLGPAAAKRLRVRVVQLGSR
jgi:hypothetical protein